jgi:hypothetical protein
MSPLVAFHATRRACRDTIQRFGLLPSRPTQLQPYGVYVFNDDLEHPTWSRGSRPVVWAPSTRLDVWQVTYIGPMRPDHLVSNGMVFLYPVTPNEVTLVTGN